MSTDNTLNFVDGTDAFVTALYSKKSIILMELSHQEIIDRLDAKYGEAETIPGVPDFSLLRCSCTILGTSAKSSVQQGLLALYIKNKSLWFSAPNVKVKLDFKSFAAVAFDFGAKEFSRFLNEYAQAEAKAEAGADAGAKPEPEPDSDLDSEAGAEPKPKPKPKPEAGVEEPAPTYSTVYVDDVTEGAIPVKSNMKYTIKKGCKISVSGLVDDKKFCLVALGKSQSMSPLIFDGGEWKCDCPVGNFESVMVVPEDEEEDEDGIPIVFFACEDVEFALKDGSETGSGTRSEDEDEGEDEGEGEDEDEDGSGTSSVTNTPLLVLVKKGGEPVLIKSSRTYFIDEEDTFGVYVDNLDDEEERFVTIKVCDHTFEGIPQTPSNEFDVLCRGGRITAVSIPLGRIEDILLWVGANSKDSPSYEIDNVMFTCTKGQGIPKLWMPIPGLIVNGEWVENIECVSELKKEDEVMMGLNVPWKPKESLLKTHRIVFVLGVSIGGQLSTVGFVGTLGETGKDATLITKDIKKHIVKYNRKAQTEHVDPPMFYMSCQLQEEASGDIVTESLESVRFGIPVASKAK